MENYCLVTKLKGVVDNDNLVKIGEYRIKIAGSATVSSEVAQTITAVNGTLLINGQTSGTITAWQNFDSFTGTGVLSFEKKYNVVKLAGVFDDFNTNDIIYCADFYGLSLGQNSSYNPENVTIKLEDIAKMGGLTSFEVFRNYVSKISGPVSALAGNTSITTLNISGNGNNSRVTGTLYDFGKIKGVTNYLSSISAFVNITGSIEDFVRGKRESGITTGNASFAYLNYNGKFTFNGEVFPNTGQNTLSWTANTITFNGVTINA